MTQITYVLVKFIALFLQALLVAMLLRALMSWFTMGEENRFTKFLYVVTEPVITPVRNLCAHFGWFTDVPVDMSFLITTIILSVVSTILDSLL
jgi:YggT family protein